MRNVRLAFRTLFRNPGFGLTVVLTLALGIGATTALFTVVNAVLLDPLPFPESRQLVQVWRNELPALTYGSASYPRYLDWRRTQRAFTDIGAVAPRGLTIAADEGPERVSGAVASASFFKVIGAAPALGSWISDADDTAAGQRVAVISHAYWQRRFAGSPNAIGQKLVIDGQPYAVIGVAPAGYAEVWRYDVWLPLGLVQPNPNRDNNFLLSYGRMREGETIDDARRALADLASQMSRENAIDTYGFTARLVHEIVTDSATQGLWVLLGATSLLLLIACANVANLLLARSVVRQRDLAIRASLGGTRAQLIAQVVAETFAIGVSAAVAGAALAWALVRFFLSLAPANFPRINAIAIDWRVLTFAVGVAIATAMLAGLGPALNVGRDSRPGSFDLTSRGSTSRRTRITSRILVVVEMSLALALVTAAGLMTKSILRLNAQDLGFTRDPVLTFSVSLPPNADAATVTRTHAEFLSRLRALSGVTHASAINMLPIARTGTNGPVRRAEDADGKGVPVTEFRSVMDGYFDAMDVRVIAGRAINKGDTASTPNVAVINDVLAAKLYPGVAPQQVVGRQIRIGWLNNVPSEVIGIVASVRSRRPDAPPDQEVYVPAMQVPQTSLSYVVRATGDVNAQTSAIRGALAEVAPGVPLATVRTLGDIVSGATQLSRMISWLSVLFAALAATLAVLGVYSVLSYAVAQRMREFAIRAAVGASRGSLVSMVLREGALLSALGIVVGILISLQSAGLIGHLLFSVSATDPVVLAVAAAGLAAVAAAGYLIPAARASKADPIGALRGE